MYRTGKPGEKLYIYIYPDNPGSAELELNGPCRDKTCLQGFRQKEIQTSLLSYRDQLEKWNFACIKPGYDTL